MKTHRLGLASIIVLAACGGQGTPGPGPAPATGTRVAIANAGFEQPATGAGVPGWALSQHAGVKAYEMGVDGTSAAEGHASFRMHRTVPQVYGAITQQVDVSAIAGKTVELSAKVRTEEVGPQGWMLVIDCAGSRESVMVAGTSDWRALGVRMKLPADAKTASIGAMLLDGGTAWLDDVQFRAVE